MKKHSLHPLKKAIARSQRLLLQVVEENSISDIDELENKLKERMNILYKKTPGFLLCWDYASTLEDEIERYQYFGLIEKKENQITLTPLGKRILEKGKKILPLE